jgi:2Fe-2S ferredoxin
VTIERLSSRPEVTITDAETVHVIFVDANGNRSAVDAIDGQSVMHAAVSNLVRGVVGECGGDLSCATCHVFVEEAWIPLFDAAGSDELDMLEATSEEPTDFSRLSCQLRLDHSHDGLVVHLPKTQR